MRLLSSALVAVVVCALFTGCSKSEVTSRNDPASGDKGKNADPAHPKVETQKAGGDKPSQPGATPAPPGGPTANFKLKDKTGEVEFGATKVPDGWPQDVVPIYPGSKISMGSHVTEGGKDAFQVVLSTPDPPEKVMAFYKDGIKLKPTEELSGTMNMLAYKDKSYPYTIVVTVNMNGGQTMMQIVAEKAVAKP